MTEYPIAKTIQLIGASQAGEVVLQFKEGFRDKLFLTPRKARDLAEKIILEAERAEKSA